MLDRLATVEDTLEPWEIDFLEALDLDKLIEAQIEILEDIYKVRYLKV
jgi:hypothetical protein